MFWATSGWHTKARNYAVLNECAPPQTSTRLLHVTSGPIRCLSKQLHPRIRQSPVSAVKGRGVQEFFWGRVALLLDAKLAYKRQMSGATVQRWETRGIHQLPADICELGVFQRGCTAVLDTEQTACTRFVWWTELKRRWIGELSPCNNLILNIGAAGDICWFTGKLAPCIGVKQQWFNVWVSVFFSLPILWYVRLLDIFELWFPLPKIPENANNY